MLISLYWKDIVFVLDVLDVFIVYIKLEVKLKLFKKYLWINIKIDLIFEWFLLKDFKKFSLVKYFYVLC